VLFARRGTSSPQELRADQLTVVKTSCGVIITTKKSCKIKIMQSWFCFHLSVAFQGSAELTQFFRQHIQKQ
jgi:hypothetical protein